MTLVGADRQLIAGAAGARPAAADRETPVSVSFCRHVVHGGGPVVIDDARDDARVCDNPAVAAGHVRAYAGYPLTSPDGQVLGAFCLVDTSPRQWSATELDSLADLAAAAESEIALRTANDGLAASAERLAAVLDTTQDAYAAIDAGGGVIAWNAAAEKLFGWTSGEVLGQQLTDLIVPERFRAAHDAGLARVRDTGESKLAGQRLQLAAVDRGGREFPIELTLQVDNTGPDLRFHAFLHDISEREEQRRQLERERQFLQTLLDNMDAGVIACDADGRLALFNQALRDFHGAAEGTGGDPTDWLLHRLYEADGRTPLARDRTPLARAFAGEDVAGDEIVIGYPDGSARRLSARGRQIRAADGSVRGAVVVAQDVTDVQRRDRLHAAQHAAARVLAEAPSYAEAARAVVEAVGAALGWAVGEYWEVDEERQVIERVGSWVADRSPVARFTGPERLTFRRGQGLPGLGWESGRTEWITDVAADPRTFIRGGIAAAESLHAAVVLPIRSPDAVLGVLLFVTDRPEPPDTELMSMLDGVGAHLGRYIERRRAEELRLALADARNDFDRVVRQISDFIWSVEVLPDGTVKPLYASPNAAAVVGAELPPGADLAALGEQLIDGRDTRARAAFGAALAEGRDAEMEVRVRGLDGVLRWVWFRAAPRRSGGRYVIDGVCTDVTDRHELTLRREQVLAREREQVRQLRALDRLKDELVALVTHELRNPIASITGFTELLQADEESLAPEHRRFVAAIARQGSHLQHLVDDLLELARLDAGQVPIDPRPVPIDPLVREVVDNHRPAADARTVTVTDPVGTGATVLADPMRLRQVLDNLLSNAIKYTPPGGAVRLDVAGAGDRVRLAVADTGIGIPADEYPKLFNRFFRASTALAKNVEGTGLGLAITKAIVERHGGAIAAHPNEGGGTVFTVELPVA